MSNHPKRNSQCPSDAQDLKSTLKSTPGNPNVREGTKPSLAANSDITLRDVQLTIDDWIQTIGVRYFSELTNLAVLMEETGELARLFARRFGDQSSKDTDLDRDIADEIADVLFVLVCLANQTGVDLTDAVRQNLLKKTKRDLVRHQNNPKLRAEPK